MPPESNKPTRIQNAIQTHTNTHTNTNTQNINLEKPGARVPVSYAALRALFRADPAVAWGGYVAGCLLVLARERGVAFEDGVSLLICSDVPEGAARYSTGLGLVCVGGGGKQAATLWRGQAAASKHVPRHNSTSSPPRPAPNKNETKTQRNETSTGKGVSSSAALEVAVMTALAAAHGVDLDGRELALLCQKVLDSLLLALLLLCVCFAALEGRWPRGKQQHTKRRRHTPPTRNKPNQSAIIANTTKPTHQSTH